MTRTTVTAVIALALVGCSARNDDPSAEPQRKIDEAEKLYAANKKHEAISLYKQYIDASGRPRQEIYARIVDFEFSQGNDAEARRWAQRAVDQTMEPPYQSGQAQALHARLYTERWGQPMPENLKKAEAVRLSRNVPLRELIEVFQGNPAIANGTYKNKYLQIWSNSFEVAGDPATGKKVVSLKSPRAKDRLTVKCYFRDDAQAAVDRLKPGDAFTVIGRGEGKDGDVIVMKHCFILEPESPRKNHEPIKPQPKSAPDPIVVSAETLAQAVQDDVNSAVKKYHLQELQVKGVVTARNQYKGKVGMFQFDVKVMDRATKKTVGFTVFCGLKEPLPDGDKRLDEIAVGKRVAVRGRSTAMGNGQVTLTGCVIVRQSDQKDAKKKGPGSAR